MAIRTHHWLAGTALALIAASPAHADAAREAALEARLKALEAAVVDLRGELRAARTEAGTATVQAAAANRAVAEARTAPVAVAAAALPPAKPAEGFLVGGTTIKINGFIKTVAAFSQYDDGALAAGSLGRDFYLPGQIPVGGAGEGRDFEASAKQTRIWMTTATPLEGHMLKSHLEFDFQTAPGTQGSQRTTNGYSPALRRGFITFDSLLVGQEWTNFQNVAALPESTDFVGPTEGTVFVRQAQLRYTHKLSPRLALSVSAENPETASISSTSAALIENSDDRLPDVTAKLAFTPGKAEVTLAGIVRQLTVDSGTAKDNATGWGVSLAGKVPFGARHDIRFMISHGEGLGRYLGLNFAPDAVYPGPGGSLRTVGVTAGFAALQLGWTSSLRSTFMGSFQKVDYPNGLAPLLANDSAWSAAANLFWSPVKPLDFGIEYRHGVRELVSGARGELDRLEFAAKYRF